MIGSMYSAVSGLSAHQTKMDVIGNNIANVNTYGYKASRATFADVFYQTLKAASSSSSNSGGVNPSQMGYGAKVSSVDVLHTRAGSATTNRTLDVYINGDGFIPIKTTDGSVKYTRAGILSIDPSGNLVDRNGNLVLGFQLDPDTGKPQLGENGKASIQELIPIKLDPTINYTGIEIGTNGEVTALQEGAPIFTPTANTGWLTGATVNEDSLYSTDVRLTTTVHPGTEADREFFGNTYKDSGGIEHTISAVTFGGSPDPDMLGALSVKVTHDGSQYTYTLSGRLTDGTTVSEAFQSTDDPETLVSHTFTIGGGSVTVDTKDLFDGGLLKNVQTEQNVSLGTVTYEQIDIKGYTYNKAGEQVVLAEQTWNAADPTTNGSITLGDITFEVDPARLGSMTKMLDETNVGSVGAGTSTPIKLGNLAVVTFPNVDGVQMEGENYFAETINSGNAEAQVPGTSGSGSLRAGALEMSNVDLSREFTEMIITQRGFQANTRMITVSDEMLSELISMKR